MKVLSAGDLGRTMGLDPEQEELLAWSVLVAGNELSKKIIGKSFPHPDLNSLACVLALHRKEPKLAENLLKARSKVPSHLFMLGDPQERTLKTLIQEYDLKISFRECNCKHNHHEQISSEPKLVCPDCHGLIKRNS